tara:strand:- start:1546 stop:2040 length:495 start_codon:yes stop_codon:yes gene_type:complete
MKKRFYVYASWEEQMELLSVDEKATMLMNLFKFQKDEEPILDTPLLKMCWASMKFLLEKDTKSYNAAVERGKTAGKSNKRLNSTITTPNDTVTVPLRHHKAIYDGVHNRFGNDNDNDNDNVNVKVKGKVNGDGDDKWEMKMLELERMADEAKKLECLPTFNGPL